MREGRRCAKRRQKKRGRKDTKRCARERTENESLMQCERKKERKRNTKVILDVTARARQKRGGPRI